MMKKAIGFVLALAVLLTAFSSCFTTVHAEIEKEFVIDGNLDVWYLTYDETSFEDNNTYHFFDLNCYNKDPQNGHGRYLFDDPHIAAEVYMAYDDTYIYVYVKCWDNDIAIHPEDEGVTQQSDSIEVWVDPDPNSQTTKPDGSPQEKNENGDYPGFPANTCDPEQGDVRFRMRAADFAVGDMHNCVKHNYGDVPVPEWYRNPENLRGFYFENEPQMTGSGEEVSSGYGLEVRIPRYDVTGGQSFSVNVACNNRQDGEPYEWYAIAMGHSWWLDYSTANSIIYAKSGNPFFDQDITGQTLYYTDNEYNAAGMAVKAEIEQLPKTITSLEKGQVSAIIEKYNALDHVQKGYVQARNFDILEAAADKVGISLEGGNDAPPEKPVVTPTDTPDVVLGNLNEDQKIDAKDALIVLKIAVCKITPTDWQKVAANVNKDNSVNAKDALEILKKSVGKEACF